MRSFPPVQRHLIESRFVEQTYRICVAQPSCEAGEPTPCPVVYAGDANLTFDLFKGISWLLPMPFILVGIGYPGDSPFAGALLRGRDFTFPGYPRIPLQSPPFEGVLAARPGTPDWHGAVAFQDFLERELVPLIDSNYPTIPGERTYFGHSGGGGFGLFTLFERPELFSNYIVSSPGVIYEGNAFLLERTRAFIASGRALPGKRLFLSVGSDEEFEPELKSWLLTTGFQRLANALTAARIPGLDLTTRIFDGETHASVWPVAFSHGVRSVLRPRTSDRCAPGLDTGS